MLNSVVIETAHYWAKALKLFFKIVELSFKVRVLRLERDLLEKKVGLLAEEITNVHNKILE